MLISDLFVRLRFDEIQLPRLTLHIHRRNTLRLLRCPPASTQLLGPVKRRAEDLILPSTGGAGYDYTLEIAGG